MRYSFFPRPFSLDLASIDNRLVERIDRMITGFSRLLGPVLLVALLGAMGWSLYCWLT